MRIALAACLLLINLLPPLPARAQDITSQERARLFLQGLTPEERVGQLFLVSFKGMDAGSETQIYELISRRHVGGVVFKAANDNFTSGNEALVQTLNLNRQLQLNYWASSQEAISNAAGDTYTPAFIPLLLSIAQEGDGHPYDQLLSGVTRLPNQMAIGATWDAALAEQAGSVLGKELSVLGFNLLLGPSVDVLEAPLQDTVAGLGTRTFGGDPYWVAQMGQAFIRGVHAGSRGDVAVAASHFPGIGSADRRPEEEVATVRKSLEQLQNFDLSPFFAVTGNAPSAEATADALLVSHIRYQGFQGNIRATTRPVSFDEQAFSSLMSLPPLATWREAGGVMISDDLGSRAVRRFYDLTNPGEPFDGRRVALTAFLAGNDLLILGDITSGEDPDAYTTTLAILDFFAQKYREDPAFAQRVDAAVMRILALKYRLFGDFNLTAVQKPLEGIVEVGLGEQVAFDVARQGATLISPSLAEMDDTAPDQSDRVVFITDTRYARQCSACPEEKLLARDALEQAVLRLYGPRAGRLVTPSLLRSYTYDDLTRLLDGDDSIYQLEIDMRRAQWLVFATLDVDRDEPSSLALQRFLAERLDLLQQKRVVIFAFNAPTFLDATDVSKLSAYYGLFSKGATFIEQAARLLFHELRPEGALPISAPGVGYDLISATMPDPLQTIPLALDLPSQETGGTTATPDPATQPQFEQGDAVPVRAGVILDHNGHPVPDGTPVQFITTLDGVIVSLPQVVTTQDGVARAMITVNARGALEIRVESEPAKASQILHFDIPGGQEPELTPTPTLEPSPTPSPTATETPQPVLTPVPPAPIEAAPHLADWLAALLLSCAAGFFVFRLYALVSQPRWAVRAGFLALIGGLLAYMYLAVGLPGSADFLQAYSSWGVMAMTLGGSVAGALAMLGWRGLKRSANGSE